MKAPPPLPPRGPDLRREAGVWMLGSRTLLAALEAAADEHASVECARAWQDLLAGDNHEDLVGAIAEALAGKGRYHTVPLVPLLARLAGKAPAQVAQMFPGLLPEEIIPLCGAHGHEPALRALASEDDEVRWRGISACLDLVHDGQEVPLEQLVAALQREDAIDDARRAPRHERNRAEFLRSAIELHRARFGEGRAER